MLEQENRLRNAAKMSASKSVFLEVDSKILENNLLLKNNINDSNDVEQMFRLNKTASDGELWQFVTPSPGFVIKTADSKGNKVFINLCRAEEIPEPNNLTEAELLALWQSDDVTNYRIPISMMDPHDELDKTGKKAVVYDVAINTKFFEKLTGNHIFRSFVVQVVHEGLENKYDIELRKDDYIILRNRTCIGELKPHKIRSTIGPYQPPKRLIEEIYSPNKKNIEEDKVQSSLIAKQVKESCEKPKFRLLSGFNVLFCQFYLPYTKLTREIKLDIGENRITIETKDNRYLIDLFLPNKIDQLKSKANFNLSSKVLTVIMRCRENR